MYLGERGPHDCSKCEDGEYHRPAGDDGRILLAISQIPEAKPHPEFPDLLFTLMAAEMLGPGCPGGPLARREALRSFLSSIGDAPAAAGFKTHESPYSMAPRRGRESFVKEIACENGLRVFWCCPMLPDDEPITVVAILHYA